MQASLRKRVRAGVSKREDFPVQASLTALLIIDVQRYLTTPPADAKSREEYFWKEAAPRMIANLTTLVKSFRTVRDQESKLLDCSGHSEVIFTFLQSATNDGRDISLDYKLSDPQLASIPRVNDSDLFLPELQPDTQQGKGDILLPKTSCSVFMSTNLHYMLGNLGIEQLVVTGQLTDQCVESAVRDAADLGYFVTVVADACAAQSAAAHAKGLASMKGFCRICTTEQVLAELIQSSCDAQENA